MIKTEPNINLLSLEGDYIFVETARAIREHEKKNPTRRIIKLGIGDTCLPLPKIVTYAMMKAAAETGERAIGYQPECGSFSLKAASSICIIRIPFASRSSTSSLIASAICEMDSLMENMKIQS